MGKKMSLALLCFGAIPGTAFAGPSDLNVSVLPGAGYTSDLERLFLVSARFEGCGATPTTQQENRLLYLESVETIQGPEGPWCEVTLIFASDLILADTTQSLNWLAVARISTAQATVQPGQTVLIPLPDVTVMEGVYGGNPKLVIAR